MDQLSLPRRNIASTPCRRVWGMPVPSSRVLLYSMHGMLGPRHEYLNCVRYVVISLSWRAMVQEVPSSLWPAPVASPGRPFSLCDLSLWPALSRRQTSFALPSLQFPHVSDVLVYRARLRLDRTLSSLESRMYWFIDRHIHAVWPGIVYILSSVSKRSVKSISAKINMPGRDYVMAMGSKN